MMFGLVKLNYMVSECYRIKQTYNYDESQKARSNGGWKRVHSGALGACNILFLDVGDGRIDIHCRTFYRNCTFRFLYK